MRHKTRPDVAALRGAPSDDTYADVNRTNYTALCPKWKPEAKTRVKCGSGIAKRYFVGRDGRLHTKRGWAPVVKDVPSNKRHAWVNGVVTSTGLQYVDRGGAVSPYVAV
jgi:hypothetical protein